MNILSRREEKEREIEREKEFRANVCTLFYKKGIKKRRFFEISRIFHG